MFWQSDQKHFWGVVGHHAMSNRVRIERRYYKLIFLYLCYIFFSDIDECKTLSHGCQLNCSNTVGSFSCYCPPTYRINPSDNKKCDDIDECTADIHNCHNQAICQNSVGSHSCTCNARYTGNGTYCRGKKPVTGHE